jgi:D-serine deaminase-like pyridoxal phosphate-dependent protein
MSELPRPGHGVTRVDLPTPALCVDLDAMERNIGRVAALCRAAGVSWRPHAKGHRSAAVARRQVAAGAIGVTAAKLGEAEVMAAGGITDVLLANYVVGPGPIARAVAVSREIDLCVAIDHADQARPLGAALAAAGSSVRVVVEVDIGMGRAGVAPGEAAVPLAREVAAIPGLRLAGVMGWEGHLVAVADPREKEERIRGAVGSLVATAQALEAAGLPCPIVSCGGTGTFLHTTQVAGVTEVQAGGAVMMDCFYREACGVEELEDALTLLTTVVSRPTPDRAIVDAGRKTHSIDIRPPRVVGRADLRVVALSAEHGTIEVAPGGPPLAIGDRLQLVPGYADLTVFLHEELYGFRGEELVEVIPVAGIAASR